MVDDAKLKELVNQSGFPLQLAIQNTIEKANIGWRVTFTEHYWSHPTTKENGYIDLVIEDDTRTIVAITECKRTQDWPWIFLTPKLTDRRRAKLWFTSYRGAVQKYCDWKDAAPDPASEESSYCVVSGQDSKSKPMLERIAADVVMSTEGFALEELQPIKDGTNVNGSISHKNYVLRVYITLIVTTAEIKICELPPSEISIADGKSNKMDFKTVPFVRFRKQVTEQYYKNLNFDIFENEARTRANESTVFVVNASHLVDFLRSFNVDNYSYRGIE